MAKKPSQGRKKIAIAKIPNKNNLQVTFSKRRSGLFKKASELCTLCGVEIAIIVFSPAKKPFSFGHPNVESILDRFLSRNSNCLNPSSNHLVVESRRNANAHELNVELSQLMSQLESERKRGDALEKMRKAGRKQCWWENPIEELDLQEMEQLKASMEELKKNVTRQVYQLTNEINSLTNTGCSQYFAMNNGVSQSVDIFERNPTEIISFSSTNIPNAFSFGYGHGNF